MDRNQFKDLGIKEYVTNDLIDTDYEDENEVVIVIPEELSSRELRNIIIKVDEVT